MKKKKQEIDLYAFVFEFYAPKFFIYNVFLFV